MFVVSWPTTSSTPPGASARDGGYVRYPLDEMMAIVALESHRNRCLVIGEDLGTVPDAMRDAMARSRVLSYRLLYFERDEGGKFLPPAAYPHDALVSITTHDLPTLAGWWSGHDVRLRGELGLFPDEVQTALVLQPFAGLLDIPLRIYFGVLDGPAALGGLAVQLFWIAALVAVGRWWLGRVLRSLEMQGG